MAKKDKIKKVNVSDDSESDSGGSLIGQTENTPSTTESELTYSQCIQNAMEIDPARRNELVKGSNSMGDLMLSNDIVTSYSKKGFRELIFQMFESECGVQPKHFRKPEKYFRSVVMYPIDTPNPVEKAYYLTCLKSYLENKLRRINYCPKALKHSNLAQMLKYCEQRSHIREKAEISNMLYEALLNNTKGQSIDNLEEHQDDPFPGNNHLATFVNGINQKNKLILWLIVNLNVQGSIADAASVIADKYLLTDDHKKIGYGEFLAELTKQFPKYSNSNSLDKSLASLKHHKNPNQKRQQSEGDSSEKNQSQSKKQKQGQPPNKSNNQQKLDGNQKNDNNKDGGNNNKRNFFNKQFHNKGEQKNSANLNSHE